MDSNKQHSNFHHHAQQQQQSHHAQHANYHPSSHQQFAPQSNRRFQQSEYSSASGAGAGITGITPPTKYKDADDLHAWSLFRQNLNANFSESAIMGGGTNGAGGGVGSGSNGAAALVASAGANAAIGVNSNLNGASNISATAATTASNHNGKSRNNNLVDNFHSPSSDSRTTATTGATAAAAATNGAFQLRESTVNNILSHPKYGAQLKNQDAFTYLRFGLPRVKVTSNVNNNNLRSNASASTGNSSGTENSTAKLTTAVNRHAQNPVDHQPPSRHYHSKNRPLETTHSKPSNGDNSNNSALNEELKRRFWNSDTNLLRYPDSEESEDLASLSAGDGEEKLVEMSQHRNQHQRYQHPSNGGARESRDPHHHHHSQSEASMTMVTKSAKSGGQSSSRAQHEPVSKSSHNLRAYSINDFRRHSEENDREPHHPNHNHHNHNHNHQQQQPHFAGPEMHGRMSALNHPNHHLQQQQQHHHHGDPRLSPSFHHHHLDQQSGHDIDIRLDQDHLSMGHGQLPPPLAKHPHLVVKDLMYEIDKSPNWRRMCGFNRQKLRVLEDISFDVRGGELLAIMATTASEGTALLDILADRHDRRNGTVRGEIYLNGVTVSPGQLSRMVAYVSRDMYFCPDMSTRQALLFAALLMGPAARASTDIKRRTRTILEELNLGEIRHTRLSELTDSERRRLHIAIHLILDTELLFLDQPLLGLDIFDAFFLVEYLRQWAMVGGRSVIMTMSPPTYEVFTMLNRVLLLSAGHTLYIGPRRDFLKYFTSLDFPCPPFKNPSDYYLDLVTLDDLSQEAMIESSQRIESLAEIHIRRPVEDLFSSMPGPPAVTPPPFRRSNLAMQFLALWIRALIFSFPYNVVQLFNRFVSALLLSLIIGGIFWQVRTGREQEFVWDRIGFISTMLAIGPIPLLISDLWNAHLEKQHVLSEIRQGFYSLPAYLLAKMLYSAPQSILIGLAYALPACSMAGLQHHTGHNSLPFYLLLMLAYFLALRSFVFAIVWSCRTRTSAITVFGVVFTLFVLGSGVNIQHRDLAFTHRWIRQISPVRWLHEALIAWEFEPNVLSGSDGSVVSSFACSRNPVIQQPNAILVRADCGFQTRSNVLRWFDYQGGNPSSPLRSSWHAFIALLILYFGSFLLGSIIFCARAYYFRDRVKTKPKP